MLDVRAEKIQAQSKPKVEGWGETAERMMGSHAGSVHSEGGARREGGERKEGAEEDRGEEVRD